MDYRAFVEELARHRRPAPENVVVFERVDSTNAAARRIADEYAGDESRPPQVLVVAAAQERGRGRRGRSWASSPGGVYATLLLALRDAGDLSTLPLLVGAGLCRALQAHLATPCRLKWPNDLVVEGAKIGGVLIDSQLRGEQGVTAIVGFGVNHGQRAEELPPGATSLRLQAGEAGELPPLGALVWDLVAGVGAELEHVGDAAHAVAAYAPLSVHRRGEPLRCRAGEEVVAGAFDGFDERGFLRLRVDGGERLVSAGEVIE